MDRFRQMERLEKARESVLTWHDLASYRRILGTIYYKIAGGS